MSPPTKTTTAVKPLFITFSQIDYLKLSVIDFRFTFVISNGFDLNEQFGTDWRECRLIGVDIRYDFIGEKLNK